ncbi:MAG: ATP-binding protein [Candidatus Omnitrophica bacterium]|nr:ATP-binding protein [Candidatus Omnitrophota bacterium]MBU4303667.1 ATP-binding protein [Candidatus Omnitrophota bacterium]MCG2707660.1 ATP-binding protein [Candidatus Omnitrophota bacterium]
MRRIVIDKLISWKKSEQRKPLILKGVRQVGKTWLLKEFGKKYYENTAYFNFDEQGELKQYFETTKDVQRIIQNLALINGVPILPGKTLIIFDEIQECNAALNALKYFCETAPEYHIVCAGSLLGIRVSKPASFPVGKVEFLSMHPMTFTEFLWALKEEKLVQYIDNIDCLDPIPDIFFNQLYEKLKMYFITGGMPESVRSWAEEKDVARVQKVSQDILNAYELDFSKHAEIKDIAKLGLIWSSIPSQLSRENKKFMYGAVKEGVRAREYEDALTWLSNAGLAYKIYRNTKPSLPVSAYDDPGAFKLYMVDVGLLRRLAFLDPVSFNEGNRLFSEFKGALSENYILQSLVAQYEGLPRYWSSGATAEVDFTIQRGNDILPIEVKSDENVRGKSFTLYNQKYAPLIRVRFSLKNLKKDNNLINIPMFLADHLDKIIGLAVKEKIGL